MTDPRDIPFITSRPPRCPERHIYLNPGERCVLCNAVNMDPRPLHARGVEPYRPAVTDVPPAVVPHQPAWVPTSLGFFAPRRLVPTDPAVCPPNGPNHMPMTKLVEELIAKLEYALSFVPTEDGVFTFPDGDSWLASSKCTGKESL